MDVIRNVQKHIENALITAQMFVLMCLLFVVQKVCHVETDTLFDDCDGRISDGIQVTVFVKIGADVYRYVVMVPDENFTLADIAPKSIDGKFIRSVDEVICDGVAVPDLNRTLKSVTCEVPHTWLTGDSGRVLYVTYECTAE